MTVFSKCRPICLNCLFVEMNMSAETDIESIDPGNRDQVIRAVRETLKANKPGILSTVDQDGFPQSRWMATISFSDFPDLYTLTSATSRKVAQIQANPLVQWMFFNDALTFVVNLAGRAELFLHDALAMKRVWEQIADRSRAYFLKNPASDGGFVVIRTKVEKIECTIPRRVLRFSVQPAEVGDGLESPQN
jgi:general stress protein 26